MQQDTANALPQRKMSRYRSRRTSNSALNAPPVPPVPQVEEQVSLARSRSRYHTKSISSKEPLKEVAHATSPPPPLDLVARRRYSREGVRNASPRTPTSPGFQQSPVEQAGLSQDSFSYSRPDRRRYGAHRVDSGTTLQSSTSYQSLNSRVGSASPPSQPHSRSPPVPEEQVVSLRPLSSEPATHIPVKHEKPAHVEGVLFPPLRPKTPPRSDGPPRSERIRAAPVVTGVLFPPPRPATPEQVDGPPRSDQIKATKPNLPLQNGEQSMFKLFKKKHTRTTSKDEQDAPRQSEDQPVVLGADAPVSAVNAGERRVMVECGNSKLRYPITPTTTPVDLIKSASNTMSEQINVRSAIMLEYFTTVGVHRPLRRYEHIRDVMNSWDHDTQNTLLIVDPGIGAAEDQLNLTGAPKSKPKEDRKWALYYSHTIGKWDKRGITLTKDGQVLLVKDPRKPDDAIKMCHLSDFDVYTPTPEKVKKKIKPPKKHCIAIKSQQKSTMFESTTNFVHFLCSSDKADLNSFHDAVQAWRSWYLVNIMGEGKKAALEPVTSPKKSQASVKAMTKQHVRNDSLDSHYQLGTFTSLIDMDMDQFGKDVSESVETRLWREHAARNGVPQRSATRKQNQSNSTVVVTAQLADDEPLAHLSRRLSMNGAKHTQPSVMQNNSSIRQPQAAIGVQRRGSTKSTYQRPLVDINQVKREPTQRVGRGRVTTLPTPREGPLVDAATSLQDQTVQTRDGYNTLNGAREPTQRTRASIELSSAQQAASYRPGNEGLQAFTGEGLLSSAQDSWGSATRGRGVLDGSRANGPMVDFQADSNFAQGSLLRKVERQQGLPPPTIDR